VGAVGWVELSLLIRYYPSAQKAKPNKHCENIPGSCWVALRLTQPTILNAAATGGNLLDDFLEYAVIQNLSLLLFQFLEKQFSR
ncbi:hypothetical protein, partial [Microcystis aeruginosa]|uniref:hypothetical protein n=1 Tax=Microcystis aeruginosa TaxID=1126 RepID=UPI001C0F4C26